MIGLLNGKRALDDLCRVGGLPIKCAKCALENPLQCKDLRIR
jgi:hypothetical protein